MTVEQPAASTPQTQIPSSQTSSGQLPSSQTSSSQAPNSASPSSSEASGSEASSEPSSSSETSSSEDLSSEDSSSTVDGLMEFDESGNMVNTSTEAEESNSGGNPIIWWVIGGIVVGPLLAAACGISASLKGQKSLSEKVRKGVIMKIKKSYPLSLPGRWRCPSPAASTNTRRKPAAQMRAESRALSPPPQRWRRSVTG